MLQETDVDIFAFRNVHFQNPGDFLGLPIDEPRQIASSQNKRFSGNVA